MLAASLVLIVAGTAWAAPLDGPALRGALDALIDGHSSARRTTVYLKVVDLQSGKVLYDRGSDKLLTPASNLKIYTSACALDTFGPDHRFATRLTLSGEFEEQGTLRGDLVLVGGGDAMLTSADLAKLADRVVDELGIRRVEGRVLVDNRRYAPRLKGPGWMWDDEPDYYNMSITPLMVDFNVLTVRLAPRPDDSVAATLVPAASYPSIVRDPRLESEEEPTITREPFTEEIHYSSESSIEEPIEQQLTMNDPAPWVASLFRQQLIDRGVGFLVEQTFGPHQQPTDPIAGQSLVHHGPTLFETLNHFNEESENAVGEVLLHEIAIASGRPQPTWADGAEAISHWLTNTAGLDAGSFRLVDGSGLSRYNLISADSSIKLLTFMQQHKHSARFFKALTEYELELAEIDWPDAPAAGFDPQRVSAKSGGMSGVSTISGYLRTLDNRLLAFSLLANGYTGTNKPQLDLRKKLWHTLVEYRK